EVDAALVERVDGHRVAQDIYVAVLLRQTLRQWLPLVSTRLAAEDTQLAFVNVVLAVALDRNYVNRVWFVRIHVDRETEVGGQITADLGPLVAGVIGAHYIPVLLHEEHSRTLRVHSDVMHAVSDFSGGIGNVL